MANNEVTICNDALSHIGVKARIQTLEDDTVEAAECKDWYPRVRDEMLERRRWTFAEKRKVLDEASGVTALTGWAYAFEAPVDMAAPRGFWNGQVIVAPDMDPIYEMAAHPDTGLPLFFTNEAAPELIYTAKVTTVAVFPPLFQRALAWHLAMKLAPGLADSPSYQRTAATMALQTESEAWASDLNSRRHRGPDPLPHYLRAR